MTYNDLCNEIISLGFETELESGERVLSAVNRALMTIFTERPLYKELTFFSRQITPMIEHEVIHHKGGEKVLISYSDEAKAYSFRTDGKGRYAVVLRSESGKTFDFSKSGELHRGFLEGAGAIFLIGDYSYTAYNFAIFDELFGDKVEDIPVISDYLKFKMSDYCDDFLSFVSLPTDEEGKEITDAQLNGGVMSIPRSYTGKIQLVYKSAPKTLSGNPNEEIILPVGCEHLPALLASAYVWLDDDAEKAQYYMSLYREAMSAVKYYGKDISNGAYYDVNGWA